MSQTKLQLFKIRISEDSNFDFEKIAIDNINLFLNDDNNVYINHSTSILTEDIDRYGVSKTINKYIVISLIYKDLNGSSINLINTSNKLKKLVKKEIAKGESILEPIIESDFELEIRALKKDKDIIDKKRNFKKM